ncbi:M23 family metallopeptidase [Pseudomonas sp. PDM23]|uniref:M23 family metallopeptidase n=1 Tax=Pseudomonas sp. PDM23 TaxID=2769275 RepID=UPI00177AC30C|nr:M23 family metallopeptidase [Pseudomonas sp. PDM23]MBD9574332.1 M23 family metallopeptidase [Pseudomonas sp. PDM23]
MIISPPFIPAPVAGETDEAFVERAMPGGNLGDGAYPLSFDLNWHGGLHLRAPQENGKNLPVRAIADGTLAFFRAPEKKTDDPNNALNYGNGWTDNGCIVLRHETEIGEGARSQVVFYSIYMHLSKINIANPQLKQRVYRKDSIGEVGEIYGSAGKIHFEIIASDTQVEHLTGRSTRELDYRTRDGRTDSCWGDMYFYVPSTLQGFAAPPSNFASPTITGAASFSFPALPAGWLTPSGSPSGLAITTTQIDGYRPEMVKQMQQGLIVRMRYDKGQCQLTTYHLTGELIGSQSEEADFEYNLYTTATRRYPACPSAGYELLRFGRVLGPDALQPADAAHWRKISLPPRTEASEAERSAWFNLNAPGVTRFSDADFPHWMGWRLIDDDDDSDSHCQSDYIRTLLEPSSHYTDPPPRQPDAASIAISPAYDTMTAGDQRRLSEQYVLDRERNEARLADAGTHEKLKRLICKFPTEWARDDFDTRYGWLKKVAAGGPMSEDDFKELKAHQEALAFWEDSNLTEIDKKHWHFPAKELIRNLRKALWLSSHEIKQLIPKHALRKTSPTQYAWEAISTNLNSPTATIELHRNNLNKTLRKYGINTPMRIASLMGNAIQETTWTSKLSEGGGPALWYAPWYGRGFLQLTSPSNYIDYWRYRGRAIPETLRTSLSNIFNAIYLLPPNQRSNSNLQDANFPQLTSEMQNWRKQVSGEGGDSESLISPSDSAGYYWASKKMAKYADSPHILERQTVQSNSGQKVYYRSVSFWKASAAVNLPSAINTTYSNAMNGFDSRCCAYGYSIAILSEQYFPNAGGQAELPFPEGYTARREQP